MLSNYLNNQNENDQVQSFNNKHKLKSDKF